MRFTLTRDLYCEDYGQSLFGDIQGDDNSFSGLTCERNWNNNERGESCVPDGFYYLEPHEGVKYKGTYALIGSDVSHYPEQGVARSACVIHWASQGSNLQGCVSIGSKILRQVSDVRLQDGLNDTFTDLLKSKKGPHYLTIKSEGEPRTTS